jgi:hypothetical protein
VNTKLTYLYRDGSNYKQWDDVVLAGAVDPEMIRRHLWEGNFFIPQAVGLPALQDRFAAQGYGFPNEDDHVWHEIESVEPTEQAPTINTTASDLAQRFKAASARGWEKCLPACL